jgi:hypothetical protein
VEPNKTAAAKIARASYNIYSFFGFSPFTIHHDSMHFKTVVGTDDFFNEFLTPLS